MYVFACVYVLQSIQFHENGKRHQNSVAKRLVDIKKNSAVERKEEQKMEMDMKRMEQVCIRLRYNVFTITF